jgi:hypothetical protein
MMTAEDRLNICRSCDHFVKSTQSCGTLILGATIIHKGKKVRLCGCVMPIKTEFAFAACAVGKWKKNFKEAK